MPIWRKYHMLIEEEIISPVEELKRADHLLHVSLKYTRTCEVMINAMNRMMSAYIMAFENYLEHARREKKIDEVPLSPIEKVKLIKELIDKPGLKYIRQYNWLRNILKSEYEAVSEFRKGLTLITKTKNPIYVTPHLLIEQLKIAEEGVHFFKAPLSEQQ